MALSIKNPLAEKLARKVAEESGDSITQAIIHSLEERLERLKGRRQATGIEEEIMGTDSAAVTAIRATIKQSSVSEKPLSFSLRFTPVREFMDVNPLFCRVLIILSLFLYRRGSKKTLFIIANYVWRMRAVVMRLSYSLQRSRINSVTCITKMRSFRRGSVLAQDLDRLVVYRCVDTV